MLFLWFLIYMLESFSCEPTQYNFIIKGESVNGYYTSFSMGTPAQNINFLLDTGSSNIAVACMPPSNQTKNYFHYNLSSSLKSLDVKVDLHYVVGQWQGFLAKEVIHLLNISYEFTIACMLSIKEIFDINSKFQGLLGLAYPSLALPNSTVIPFLNKLNENRTLQDIFSIDLCGPYFSSKQQETQCGQFTIGSIFTNYSYSEIVYTPIIKEWFYEVLLTNLKVGKYSVPVHCWELNQNRTSIDTGTTNLYLPQTVYKWVLNEVKHQVLQHFPKYFWVNETVACIPNNKFQLSKFPTLTLTLYHTLNSSFDLIISPEQYLIPVGNLPSVMECVKLAFSMSEHSTVIGSSILKGYFVIFDRQNKRMGFANSTNFLKESHFPGIVKKPSFSTVPIEFCKKSKAIENGIKPLLIVLLCASVAASIAILYMMVSWMCKHFNLHNDDDSSETSSLVDGIILETWNVQESDSVP